MNSSLGTEYFNPSVNQKSEFDVRITVAKYSLFLLTEQRAMHTTPERRRNDISLETS